MRDNIVFFLETIFFILHPPARQFETNVVTYWVLLGAPNSIIDASSIFLFFSILPFTLTEDLFS